MNKTKVCQFKNHIYRLRKSRGYGQKRLAVLLGLRSAKRISDYETGRQLPTLRTGLMLEIVLGARLTEIYVDLYRCLQRHAVDREAQLPPSFTRHIRHRVLGEDTL